MISGVLVVDKPEGWTSMDVVRLAKRLSRQRRVGHAGTLDPQATGVLPVLMGHATRLMDTVINGTKAYRGAIRLGVSTDTHDRQGRVVAEADVSPLDVNRIEEAASSFEGVIEQVPPMYSALKREGQRLYDIARAGETVPREPRRVTVSRFRVLGWDPPELTVEIECQRGVYVRSLAHDLGEALGCGGHLSRLTRLRAGVFTLESASSVEELRASREAGGWKRHLYPMDAMVCNLRAAVVGSTGEAYLRNGQAVGFPIPRLPQLHRESCRIYTADGNFLGLASYHRARHQWHPEKVFPRPEALTSGGRPV